MYIYPLPQKFNRELLEQCEVMLPWYNMCPHFQVGGWLEGMEGLEGDGERGYRGWLLKL